MKPVLSLECSCQPWEFGFFFLLGTGLVVTGVIISSCHSEGKNRIGRFGNFGARCAWSMTVIITLECTILAHWGAPQHPGLGWPLVLLSVLLLTSLTGHICCQSSLLCLVPLFTCLLYFIWANSHSPPGKGQSGPQLVVKKANQPLLPVSRGRPRGHWGKAVLWRVTVALAQLTTPASFSALCVNRPSEGYLAIYLHDGELLTVPEQN